MINALYRFLIGFTVTLIPFVAAAVFLVIKDRRAAAARTGLMKTDAYWIERYPVMYAAYVRIAAESSSIQPFNTWIKERLTNLNLERSENRLL